MSPKECRTDCFLLGGLNPTLFSVPPPGFALLQKSLAAFSPTSLLWWRGGSREQRNRENSATLAGGAASPRSNKAPSPCLPRQCDYSARTLTRQHTMAEEDPGHTGRWQQLGMAGEGKRRDGEGTRIGPYCTQGWSVGHWVSNWGSGSGEPQDTRDQVERLKSEASGRLEGGASGAAPREKPQPAFGLGWGEATSARPPAHGCPPGPCPGAHVVRVFEISLFLLRG